MRWKPEPANAPQESAVRSEDVVLRDRVSGDLQARGVAASDAEVLADRVVQDLSGRTREDYDKILDGVAIGLRIQTGISQDLSRSATDLQEIERLMSSFAGELTKLDEVLEVLAAYLRRLRTASPAAGSQILH